MQKGAPVFVKVDDYKEILDVLDMVKLKISEMRQSITAMNSLKDEEDAELQVWANAMDSLQNKIENIDKMLYEPEQEY